MAATRSPNVANGSGAIDWNKSEDIICWSYLGFALSGRKLAGEELDLLLDALTKLADAGNRRRR